MVRIRRARKEDIPGIVHVCYKTGYMGEDATPYFEDEKLFGYFFSQYYPENEPQHSFVAEDDGEIVGYILSSPDTRNQQKRFLAKMGLRIAFRLFLITSIRYPKTFFTFLKGIVIMLKYLGLPGGPKNIPHEEILEKYPAHLHINLLEPYQRKGIGGKLIDNLEAHLRRLGVKGIHLETSEQNKKAVPFYKKKGFKIVRIDRGNFWSNAPEVRRITFAKTLD
ncbi:MAG: GNAT family N-acetyltransferase [Candidatus Helarchaeales archaeon]